MVFMAKNIPALGSAVYTIIKNKTLATTPFIVTNNSISNGKITLTWDNKTGSITHFTDNGTTNYAGSYNNQGLNSYWYVPGSDPKEAKSNTEVQTKILENGPVMVKVLLTAEAPGANKLERIITLYKDSDEALLENIVDKNLSELRSLSISVFRSIPVLKYYSRCRLWYYEIPYRSTTGI